MEISCSSLMRVFLNAKFQVRKDSKKFMVQEKPSDNWLCFTTPKEPLLSLLKLMEDFMHWIVYNLTAYYAKMYLKRVKCATVY